MLAIYFTMKRELKSVSFINFRHKLQRVKFTIQDKTTTTLTVAKSLNCLFDKFDPAEINLRLMKYRFTGSLRVFCQRTLLILQVFP